jgi:hypothetical protein
LRRKAPRSFAFDPLFRPASSGPVGPVVQGWVPYPRPRTCALPPPHYVDELVVLGHILLLAIMVPVPGDGAPRERPAHERPSRDSFDVTVGPVKSESRPTPRERNHDRPERARPRSGRTSKNGVQPAPFVLAPDIRAEIEARQQHIVSVIQQVNGAHGWPTVPTSGFRTNSAAHARGAIDFRAQGEFEELQERALEYSRALGADYTVVLEWVDPQRGKLTHVPYRAGGGGPPKEQDWYAGKRGVADATHIHVQPDRPLVSQPAGSFGPKHPPTGPRARPTKPAKPAHRKRGSVRMFYHESRH